MTPASALRIAQRGLAGLMLSLLWLAPRVSKAAEHSARPSGGSERGEVTLSTAEYRRLVEAGERPNGKPGQEVAFEAARFRVTIEKESALFAESFRARTAASGWVSAPFARMALDRGSVSPSGRGFLFVSREVDQFALLGPSLAECEISARVATSAGPDGHRSLTFSLPWIPVQRGEIELPLSGVTVTLRDGRSARSAVTDAQGFYRFMDVPAGNFRLRANLPGFSSVERPITLPAGGNVGADLTLKLSAKESVTVTASEEPLRIGGSTATSANYALSDGVSAAKRAAPAPLRERDVLTLAEKAALQRTAEAGVNAIAVELPETGKRLRFEGRLFVTEIPTLDLLVRPAHKGWIW